MKIHLIITTLILVLVQLSCNNSKIKDKENANNPTTQQINLFDSIDNNSYVGFVNKYYFQKTDEFYIELYSKSNSLSFEKISELADSVIYRDDENTRSRIPLNIASKEFDFRGIEELTLFDEKHNELTKAHFIRVELLEGNIFSDFTAVYKTQNSKLLDKAVYCIGNLKEKLTKATYIEFVDSLLTNEIANKLNLTQTYTLEGKHYIDRTKKDTISVINLDKSAQIIEKMNSEYKSIYGSKVTEQIFKLTFIPITRNSRPILLTESMEPETDNGWNSVLVYDGTKYVETDRQRIKN
jgi:hypothetical protein